MLQCYYLAASDSRMGCRGEERDGVNLWKSTSERYQLRLLRHPPLHPFHMARALVHIHAKAHSVGLITHKLSPGLQLITMRRVLLSTPFHCPFLPSAWSCTVVPLTMLMVPRPYLCTNIEDMFPFSTFICTQAPLRRAHFES